MEKFKKNEVHALCHNGKYRITTENSISGKMDFLQLVNTYKFMTGEELSANDIEVVDEWPQFQLATR